MRESGGGCDPAECTSIHLDAVGGIAGDMFVASMLDCFPSLVERVMYDVAAVLPQELAASLSEGMSGGIRVRRFGLSGDPARAVGPPPAREHRRHSDDRDGHDHSHDQGHPNYSGDRADPHRHGVSFARICDRITTAHLSEGTAQQAVAILRILAEAEAHVHDIPVQDVHFHEVGDWDSVMDVVAAGSIAAALCHVAWTISPLPRGAGLVRTHHGFLPVPAPATAKILESYEWRDDGVSGERVTPTGGAIVRHLCAPSAQQCVGGGRLLGTGTGAGIRELRDLPNVLRSSAFGSAHGHLRADVLVVSFTVDDMTGEEIGTACNCLRPMSGVLDILLLGALGKKGRPATRFELLVVPDQLATVIQACFEQTSTIGLRWHAEQRTTLTRAPAEIDGRAAKAVTRPNGVATYKVESDAIESLGTLAERRAAAWKLPDA